MKHILNIRKRKKLTRKQRRIALVVAVLLVFLLVDASTILHRKVQQNRNAVEKGEFEITDADKKKTDANGNEVVTLSKLNLYVLDVGQGESILLDCGNTEILIDGGTSESTEAVLDKLEACVDGDLEYVINLDCKKERTGGLPAVYEKYHVKNTLYAREPGSADSEDDHASFKAFLSAAKKDGGNIQKITNANYTVGGGAVLTLLTPTNDEELRMQGASCTATLGKNTILILGNADADRMKEIASNLEETSVVVCGKNGGTNALSQYALERLNPRYLLISCSAPDKNGGAYPAADTLQALKSASKVAYATYNSGTIYISLTSDDTINTSLNSNNGVSQ